MKVIDLFSDKVANIKISYGIERQRHLEEKDKTLKKTKKVKVKKNKKKIKK